MSETGPENVVVPEEATPAEGTVGSSVPEESTEEEETDDEESDTSDLDEIAKEVLAGKWGEGQEQRLKLAEAGYDHREVHDAVVRVRNNL